MSRLAFLILSLTFAFISCSEGNSDAKVGVKAGGRNDSAAQQINVINPMDQPVPELTDKFIGDYSYMLGRQTAQTIGTDPVEKDFDAFFQGLSDKQSGAKCKYTDAEMFRIRMKFNDILKKNSENLRQDPNRKTPPPIKLPTDFVPKFSYVLGYDDIGKRMEEDGIKINMEMMKKGFYDTYNHSKDSLFTQEELDTINNKFGSLIAHNHEKQMKEWLAQAPEQQKLSEAFLKEKRESGQYTVADSGFYYKIIKQGKGRKPLPDEKVKANIKAFNMDGTKFDDTYEKGEPVLLYIPNTLHVFKIALPMMNVGSVWEIVAPASLTFEDKGMPPNFKPGAATVFQLELVSIDGKAPDFVPPPNVPKEGKYKLNKDGQMVPQKSDNNDKNTEGPRVVPNAPSPVQVK